ncbi:MAG: copper chaperone PCu(A)C [Pseudomonadota bacterium]
MKTPLRAALAALALLTVAPAAAHDYTLGPIVIDHPWARPTIPNRPTAGYFELENTGDVADRLVAARSPAFGRIEFHRTSMKDGVMKMEAQEAVEIPPGASLAFARRGYHVMLFDAVEQLGVGDRFPLELVFENAGAVTVELIVDRRGPKAEAGGMDHSGHGGGHDGTKTN